ncbi:MAG: peptidase S41, partial [Sphingobium yanoikuyae]|nr:peptidase S41 [Sphingobium yanoikuyae]
YKSRPKFRESDLRRHLINEIKTDNAALEEDSKDDPRFTASAEDLKKKGIDDFQLDYALKTLTRLAGKPGGVVALAQPSGGRKPGAR